MLPWVFEGFFGVLYQGIWECQGLISAAKQRHALSMLEDNSAATRSFSALAGWAGPNYTPQTTLVIGNIVKKLQYK